MEGAVVETSGSSLSLRNGFMECFGGQGVLSREHAMTQGAVPFSVLPCGAA